MHTSAYALSEALCKFGIREGIVTDAGLFVVDWAKIGKVENGEDSVGSSSADD